MNINNSPWIEQLQRTIPLRKISQNSKTEIVIVGGGIAGITTAFFILKNSNLIKIIQIFQVLYTHQEKS